MSIRYHQEMVKLRIFVVLLVLGVLGWLALLLMQRQLGVGRFAESPQQVRLRPGQRAVVGGGRAVLGFINESRETITVEVRCAAAKRLVLLRRGNLAVSPGNGDDSEAVCGVKVHSPQAALPIGINIEARTFEISWGE